MLNTQQQQLIREHTGWPDDIICYIGSMPEAEIYMRAKLQARRIGGKWVLCRTDINWADYSIRRER